MQKRIDQKTVEIPGCSSTQNLESQPMSKNLDTVKGSHGNSILHLQETKEELELPKDEPTPKNKKFVWFDGIGC